MSGRHDGGMRQEARQDRGVTMEHESMMRLRQSPNGDIEATSGGPFKDGFYLEKKKGLIEVAPEEPMAMMLGIGWFMCKEAGFTRQEFMSSILHSARQVVDTFGETEEGSE